MIQQRINTKPIEPEPRNPVYTLSLLQHVVVLHQSFLFFSPSESFPHIFWFALRREVFSSLYSVQKVLIMFLSFGFLSAPLTQQ